MIKIPFNKPSLWGNELRYIRDAVQRGHISGDGYYTQKCSSYLEGKLGVSKILMTPSCTHALEMAFLLADLPKDSEIILPSFAFPSTANAFVLRGLHPRFVDIRPDTLNLDENLFAKAVTRKTRAVIPVHYAGVPCDMDRIGVIARRHHLDVIEDAAQALGASWNGRAAGSFGRFNAFSFHETKNCTSGEGGALVLTRKADISRAEIIRQKGTNRARFYRGEVDKYSWVGVGSSYVPSELQMAYLYAQLTHLKNIHRMRKRVYQIYMEALEPYQRQGRLQLPHIPREAASSYHLFYVIFPSERERNFVLRELQKRKILAVFHFFPLHLSKMGKRWGYARGDFPISERTSACLLRLPVYNTLDIQTQHFVIQQLRRILDRKGH